MPNLSDVVGIGTEYAKALRKMGIKTLSDLAGADAVTIEATLGSVTVEQVRGWIKSAQAKLVLEQASAPATTRLKVISPAGAFIMGIGERRQGEILEVDAALAALLLEQNPSVFVVEG